MRKQKLTLKEMTKKAAQIKINKALDTIENQPAFREKMERGAKILAIAGLPKMK